MFTYKPLEARIPINVWMTGEDCLDAKTREQLFNLCRLPFAFKHIGVMPDAHMGYGMPIGGVLATHNTIIPHAIGSDIACGMCATKTNVSIDGLSHEILTKILSQLRGIIPVGFNKHKKPQAIELMPLRARHVALKDYLFQETPICYVEFDNAIKSLGTLGGGNHFIELQKDEDGLLWVMIHSGSRNLGYKVCEHYNNVAINLNKKWHSSILKQWELAFLPFNSKEGQQYFKEMDFCIDYAYANRALMMDRTIQVIMDVLQQGIKTEPMINIAHNYAAMENHFNQNVLVHRKGATRARLDEIGIIPGSQGSNSYIVKGLGNPESFMSCSHGAGRKLGRKQAIRELNLAEEQRKLEELGVIHSVRGKKSLDEAPGAYKDIGVVMNDQRGLVEIVTRLTPLAVLKG